MWKYGVAVVVVLLLVLFFVGLFSKPKPTASIRCVGDKGLRNPVWQNQNWECPKDTSPISTCSDDSGCQEGYRCDEVCKINCTNSEGTLDELAITDCGSGYYSAPWKSAVYRENESLLLPNTIDGKKLQIKNSFYGNMDIGCSSDVANKLIDDANAGLDIAISPRNYNTYFGVDPCPGKLKVTSLDYRYV